MPREGSVGVAATPRIGNSELRRGASDHEFGGLAAIQAGNASIGDAGVGGSGRRRQNAQIVGEEVAAHVGGQLGRGRHDFENGIYDGDRVAGHVRAGRHRQRGIPLFGAGAVRRRRAGTVPLPAGQRWDARGRRSEGVGGTGQRPGSSESPLCGVAFGGQPCEVRLLVCEYLLYGEQFGDGAVLSALRLGRCGVRIQLGLLDGGEPVGPFGLAAA